ncbi:hypothetical protein H0H92_006245, partial [Tricholoma furcatifolium]
MSADSKDIKVLVKGPTNSWALTITVATQTFHETVSTVAKKQSESAGTRFETSGSYGIVSASVSGEYSINNELEDMLQDTNRSETTIDVQLTTTETQKYPVGAFSTLYVYYRYFEGPGMTATSPVPVTRPTPLPKEQMTEEVDIEVVLAPMPLLKRLHIVSSRLGTEAPPSRIRERFGKNDNINHDQGGIYVWLVPEMTTTVSDSLTHIDLVIRHRDSRTPTSQVEDMVHTWSKGRDYRYLLEQRAPGSKMAITSLQFIRSPTELLDVAQ